MVGRDKIIDFHCVIIVVYGQYSRSERQELWAELENMRNLVKHPLIFIGDFNEVLHLEERGKVLCRQYCEF